MKNVWAVDQFGRYCDAARRLRAAAERQEDISIAKHLREIADRYEVLAKTIARLRT